MRRKFKGGTTELNLSIVVYDTTLTNGGGLTGLTHATSGLILEYRRAGQSTWTQLGVATGLVSKTLAITFRVVFVPTDRATEDTK